MLHDLLVAEPQGAVSIVVEDVALLLLGEEVSAFDGIDGQGDCLLKHHLIGPEHETLGEPILE